MSSQTSPDRRGDNGQGDGDPWAAFGYLVAGVGFYGFLGWGAGQWLHASYLTPIGLMLGMLFGMFMVFARYKYRGTDDSPTSARAPIENDRSVEDPAKHDDRGETQ
jgi:ATP synthase protein I